MITEKENRSHADSRSVDTPFSPELTFVDRVRVQPLLQRIEQPGRYTGGEFGIPNRDPSVASVRLVLSYPDTYELGMSNQGLKILYDVVNRHEDFFADRAFLPWPDFGEILSESDIPLYSLDHQLEIRSFDLWGFNTAHELHFTNLLYALDLAQIPLRTAERGATDPFIVTGGTAVSNPLPLFDFMDAIFMGDGEDAILEILSIIAAGKRAGATRTEIASELRQVDGLLLPQFYTSSYNGRASYQGPPITKRNYRGPQFAALEHVLVPNLSITQDRVVVEVARGCGQGCRFCHAGFWKRPVRNSEVATLVRQAGEMLDRTGNDSISLHSLSIADYPWLEELVVEMANAYGPRGVSLSLPSLRVQVKTIPVLQMTQGIRRSSVTFALEAASELQREKIRKKSSEENLHYLIREVYARGWDLVKVYFMLGLPDRDGHEVDDLIRALNDLGTLAEEAGSRKHVNVTVSLFVPKPFTTFQWEEQRDPEYFYDAIHRIKRGLTSKRVHLKYPDPWMAFVEGLLSRSDTRVGEYLLQAYRNGARFDSWDDRFNRSVWEGVLDLIPSELRQLWTGKQEGGGELPWHDIVDGMTISREKLTTDFKKFEAINEENMNPPHPQALRDSDFPPELLKPVEIPPERMQMVQVLEIEYAKRGNFRYISHLDTIETIRKACRRAHLPMTFSQGFNKHEKFHMSESLPLYFESELERAQVELFEPAIDLAYFHEILSRNMPEGLVLLGLRLHDSLPRRRTEAFRYRLAFSGSAAAEYTRTLELLRSPPENLVVTKKQKKRKKLRALKRGQSAMRTVEKRLAGALRNVHSVGHSIEFELEVPDSGAVSMVDMLNHYLNLPASEWNVKVSVTRLGPVEPLQGR